MSKRSPGARDRFLMQALAIVLAAAGAVAVPVAGADVVQDQRRDLPLPAAAAVRRRRWTNYAALWTSEFRNSFANSLIVGVVSTVLSLLIGVPAAYALSRWTTRAGGTITLWILASRMAPPIAFTIPYFLVYRHLELLDTLTGLIIIYLTFNLSLVIWMMRPFYDQLPRSLEEAAWIDGATMWQGFYRIILPLSGPGLAATAILCFLFAWNDFFFALILTRTEAMTAPVAVVNFMNYEGWEWGRIAAGGTMIMLPVLVFSFLVRRYLVHGLTGGALKG